MIISLGYSVLAWGRVPRAANVQLGEALLAQRQSNDGEVRESVLG